MRDLPRSKDLAGATIVNVGQAYGYDAAFPRVLHLAIDPHGRTLPPVSQVEAAAGLQPVT